MEIERCPSCGSPSSMPHLRNCKRARHPGGPLWDKPTIPMIDQAKRWLRQLGLDEEYNPDEMSFAECSDLLDRLSPEIAALDDLRG